MQAESSLSRQQQHQTAMANRGRRNRGLFSDFFDDFDAMSRSMMEEFDHLTHEFIDDLGTPFSDINTEMQIEDPEVALNKITQWDDNLLRRRQTSTKDEENRDKQAEVHSISRVFVQKSRPDASGKLVTDKFSSNVIAHQNATGDWVAEKKATYKNEGTGVKKTTHEKILNDKGCKIVKELVNGAAQDTQCLFHNMQPEESEKFESEWNKVAQSAGFEQQKKLWNQDKGSISSRKMLGNSKQKQRRQLGNL